MRGLFLFLFLSATIYAQEAIIIDDEGNPISNVSAFNSLKTKSVLSDNNGVINLSRFLEKDTVFFQHPNYNFKKVIKGNIVGYVELEAAYNLLKDVVVLDKKNKNNIKNVAEKKIYITKNKIKALALSTSAEMLEKSGGVSVQRSQLGGGSPNIRGFEANKVLLMLDGVRLNNAIYRSGHLQNIITIDDYMLEDVEIVFGPSSVLFGSDALGGTINMKTREVYFRSEPTWKASVSSSYHSAYSGFKDNILTSFESSKYSSISTFSFKSFGDLRMGNWRPHGYPDWGLVHHYINPSIGPVCNDDPSVQRGVGYTQYDFFNKMIFKLGETSRITSNIQYSTSSNIPRFDKLNDNDTPCLAALGEAACPMISDLSNSLKFHSYYYGPQKRFFSSLRISLFKNKNYEKYFDRADLIFAYQNVQESRHKWQLDDFEDYLSFLSDTITPYNPPSHQYESVNVFSLNTNFQKGSCHFGSETSYNSVSSKTTSDQELSLGGTRYPGDGASLFSTACYANILLPISHKFQLEGGVRATFSQVMGIFPDSIHRDYLGISGLELSEKYHILSGNLKFIYFPNDSWKFSSVTSRGFHVPNVDDMLKVFEKGDNITIPNTELKPEFSLSQEFSITKSISENITLHAVGFYTTLANAIIKDSIRVNLNPDPDGAPFWTSAIAYNGEEMYTFANQNRNESVGIYGLSFGFSAKINNIQLNGDFNFSQAKKSEEISNPIAHIPPNFGRLEVFKTMDKWTIRGLCLYSGHKGVGEFDQAGVDNLDETPLIGIDPETNEEIWAGLPGWFTLNLSFQYEFRKNIELILGIDNIFDAHYKAFGSGISSPGRNFIVSLNCVF